MLLIFVLTSISVISVCKSDQFVAYKNVIPQTKFANIKICKQKLLSIYQHNNVYWSTIRPYSNNCLHPYGRQTSHGRQNGQNNFNNNSWGCDKIITII